MKTCTLCARSQPAHAFSSDRSRPDGLYSRCKACCRWTARQRRADRDGRQAVTEYERHVSMPAAAAGMTEVDWIVHRDMAAAYADAAITAEAAA